MNESSFLGSSEVLCGMRIDGPKNVSPCCYKLLFPTRRPSGLGQYLERLAEGGGINGVNDRVDHRNVDSFQLPGI